MYRFVCVVGLICLSLLSPRAAGADVILDAHFVPYTMGVPSSNLSATLGGGYFRGQSFTVENTGLLVGVDLLLETYFDEPDLVDHTFYVLAMSGLNPNVVTPLSSVTMHLPRDSSGFVSGALSTPFQVTAGEMYMIGDFGSYVNAAWSGNWLNPNESPEYLATVTMYSSGMMYWGDLSQGEITAGGNSYDLGFRTYVDVGNGEVPVPEPATLLLVGTGLAAAVAARRRRK